MTAATNRTDTDRAVPHRHDRRFEELTASELYAILQLRNQVFVVEQGCAYLDLDGRDTAPNVRHIWVEHGRRPIGYCRMFDDGIERVIGRVVTSPAARGSGLASSLIDYCLATSDGPWRLSAQTEVTGLYRRLGFECVGDVYDDHGIDHIDMIRPADGR